MSKGLTNKYYAVVKCLRTLILLISFARNDEIRNDGQPMMRHAFGSPTAVKQV